MSTCLSSLRFSAELYSISCEAAAASKAFIAQNVGTASGHIMELCAIQALSSKQSCARVGRSCGPLSDEPNAKLVAMFGKWEVFHGSGLLVRGSLYSIPKLLRAHRALNERVS